MRARLHVRRHRQSGRYVFRLEGEVDGSTACHALDVLARAPADARKLLLDLSALTRVDAFGLAVLSRGLRQLARGRALRLDVSSRLLPALTPLTDELLARL